MIKIILAMFAFIVLSSCSKDNDENYLQPIPSDGQYVGTIYSYDSEHSNTFSLTLENGVCTDFELYSNAERFNYYTPAEFRTSGAIPMYTYHINGLEIQAQFIDSENFTANISGCLSTHKGNNSDVGIGMISNLALELFDVHFRLDNTPLDANNDGVLDCKQ